MQIQIKLRDRLTGLEIVKTENDDSRYGWLQGNFACDCNRSLILYAALDIDKEQLPCSESNRGRVDIIEMRELDTNTVWYTEYYAMLRDDMYAAYLRFVLQHKAWRCTRVFSSVVG